MKRITQKMLGAMVLALTLLLAVQVKPEAASIGRQNFKISYISTGNIGIELSLPARSWAEVQLCGRNKRVLAKTEAMTYASFYRNFRKNYVYYYRIRPFHYSDGKKIYDGKWTAYKAFIYLEAKVNLKKGTHRTVQFRLPKMAGVRYGKLRISKNKDSGYKVISRIKPGQTKNVMRFNGSTFDYNVYYYYDFRIKLADGVPCTVPVGQFYLYRTYR